MSFKTDQHPAKSLLTFLAPGKLLQSGSNEGNITSHRAKRKRKRTGSAATAHSAPATASEEQTADAIEEGQIFDSFDTDEAWDTRSFKKYLKAQRDRMWNRYNLNEELAKARDVKSWYKVEHVEYWTREHYFPTHDRFPKASESEKQMMQKQIPGGSDRVNNHMNYGVKSFRVALDEHENGRWNPKRIVFYTDGSFSDQGSGAGIAYQESVFNGFSKWRHCGYHVPFAISSTEAEAAAMLHAVEIANRMNSEYPNSVAEVHIYTESQANLEALSEGKFVGKVFLDELVKRTWVAHNLNCKVQMSFVVGHSRVPGNVRADSIAKTAGSAKGLGPYDFIDDESALCLSDANWAKSNYT